MAANETPADRIRNAQDVDDIGLESDLWAGGYSGKSMIGSWIAAGVLTLGAAIASFAIPFLRENSTVLMVVWILVLLVWGYLGFLVAYRKLAVRYHVTSQQLKHREGILFRRIDRIEMIDIDDVNYRQGPIQAILGVGDISIKSSDTSHPELVMRGIASVEEISELINDARRQERRKRGLHIEAI